MRISINVDVWICHQAASPCQLPPNNDCKLKAVSPPIAKKENWRLNNRTIIMFFILESSDVLLPTTWDADTKWAHPKSIYPKGTWTIRWLSFFPVKTYLKHPEMKKNLPKYLQTHTWTPPKNGCQIDEGLSHFECNNFQGPFWGPNRYTFPDGWNPQGGWVSEDCYVQRTCRITSILGLQRCDSVDSELLFLFGVSRKVGVELGWVDTHTQKKNKAFSWALFLGCFLW